MGNCLSPFSIPTRKSHVKLVFLGGGTRILTGTHVAGEVLFEFPDMLVCHSDSFFIGHSIPSLSINDKLVAGETYFVLPIDCFSCDVISASSLAGIGRCPVKLAEPAFQYSKSSDGTVLIKVEPEFIRKLITGDDEDDQAAAGGNGSGFLCSTPELQNHYNQLVGSRIHGWSPKLETISEQTIDSSPRRRAALPNYLSILQLKEKLLFDFHGLNTTTVRDTHFSSQP